MSGSGADPSGPPMSLGPQMRAHRDFQKWPLSLAELRSC